MSADRPIGSPSLDAVGGKPLTGGCLLHLNFESHPGMNAAPEVMSAFRYTRHQRCAALEYAGLGHGDIVKSSRAFWNRSFAIIQASNEAAAKLFYFGEGMRLSP